MNYTQKLTGAKVLQIAATGLDRHLPLGADGVVCTSADAWRIVLGAAAQQQSIHATCASLENAPSDASVRNYLNARLTVDTLPEIEECMNAALAAQIPKRVLKKARDTAMDGHDQAYYGRAIALSTLSAVQNKVTSLRMSPSAVSSQPPAVLVVTLASPIG